VDEEVDDGAAEEEEEVVDWLFTIGGGEEILSASDADETTPSP